MLKKMRARVSLPEPHLVAWGLGLPVSLILVSLIAKPLGLLMVASLRDEELATPSALTIFWGTIIASLPLLWLILQLTANANLRAATQNNQPPLPLSSRLSLTPSRHRSAWISGFTGFAVMAILDNLALLIGPARDSLPLGLDRVEDSTPATWLGAVLVFLIFLPIIEEIVFRALLYPALAQRFADNWRGLLATTAVFVGYYLIQTAGDLSEWSVIYGGIIFPLVLGFTAGLARATNKSTWSALACHFGFNLFLVFKAALLFG